MPLFELRADRGGRLRVFLRAQLPLLLGSAFVGTSAAIAIPDSFETGSLWAGLIVIGIASIAAAVVPWEKIAPAWMISIAVADILGVALMRAALLWVVPSVGILVIFPILWLSYGFRRGVFSLAIGGAAFVSAVPFLLNGAWPSTGVDWLNLVTLPVLIVGVAIVVNVAAAQLRRNLEKLDTANREQQTALRRALDNEILARGILDTVNAGVAFYSPDNRLQLSNQLANDMVHAVGFRLDQPPYAGRNVLAADRSTAIPFEDQIIPRALRGELIEDHMEWLGPPGQQTAIIAASRRVHREDGVLLGTVVMAYDVTELAAAVAIREEFLGTVSHELRTPLTSVLGYLELIADDLDPAQSDALAYLRIVQRNMTRLTDRIADMMGAAETDLLLHTASTDIGKLVESCVDRARETDSSIDIRLVEEGELTVAADVDARRISEAVDELLTNAVKFSPLGSAITVTVTTQPERAVITVADRGSGLTRAEQGRVFDRFYRGQNARTRAVQGFGLGLSVVKNIVDAHRGQTTISDSPGGGTTVTIALPYPESA